MTREYEAVYIFDSALEDAAITEKLSRHHGLLSLTEEAKLDIWGRRQLAYKIGRHENGSPTPRPFPSSSGRSSSMMASFAIS